MALIKDRIKEAMESLSITGADLAKRTGLAASSISQYLSGKTRPSRNAIMLMSEALGVTTEWLEGREGSECINHSSQNLTCKQVAKLMGKDDKFVRLGLQQGILPFGYAVKTSTRWTYFINREKFEESTGIKIG